MCACVSLLGHHTNHHSGSPRIFLSSGTFMVYCIICSHLVPFICWRWRKCARLLFIIIIMCIVQQHSSFSNRTIMHCSKSWARFNISTVLKPVVSIRWSNLNECGVALYQVVLMSVWIWLTGSVPWQTSLNDIKDWKIMFLTPGGERKWFSLYSLSDCMGAACIKKQFNTVTLCFNNG